MSTNTSGTTTNKRTGSANTNLPVQERKPNPDTVQSKSTTQPANRLQVLQLKVLQPRNGKLSNLHQSSDHHPDLSARKTPALKKSNNVSPAGSTKVLMSANHYQIVPGLVLVVSTETNFSNAFLPQKSTRIFDSQDQMTTTPSSQSTPNIQLILTNVFGYLATVFLCILYLPQVWKVYREKNAHSLSIFFLIISLLLTIDSIIHCYPKFHSS